MLESTMMDYPLIIPSILERARTLFPHKTITTVLPVGLDPETKAPIPGTHRMTYGELYPRVMQLCNALTGAGIQSGDRVATLAVNTYRHLELYFAVPSVGAVCHMVNIRLPPEQIVYIINHAEDRILFVDNVFAAMLPALLPHCPKLEKIIVMGPVPGGLPANVIDYETFIADQPDTFAYPEINERQASGMCYTSGTTGNPKGVLYSHRGIVLHSLASMATDLLGVNESDTLMAIVPMFHVNAWGFPYSCAMSGANQVYMSVFTQAPLIARTLESEKVTIGAGVPTIWLGLLDELDRAKTAGNPYKLEHLKSLLVGGSAAPRPMIEAFGERHGLHITHAWGMTETTPLGTINNPAPQHTELRGGAKYDQMALTGRASPLIDIEIVDGDGSALTHDGQTPGRLLVKGPWVTAKYFKDEAGSAATAVMLPNAAGRPEHWFDTGDIATINTEGFMLIQDRAKDLIKSGGEWISSVDLENTLMGHPAVKEAAVIALPHPKWDERPFGVIVLREGSSATMEELNAHLLGKFAKWQLPDDYAFVESLPLTATGKFLKRALRDKFKEHKLPGT
jgi:fatty-acyl-CoA synthase